jgi:Restriction endonuclease
MTQPWQKFERVVAAIHVAEEKGATVTWNEDIEGRQFDVVIRFKFQFYDYLVLIECKDWKRPVKVEKVDAFVTKSKAATANKAIMVSASGFQDGARKVARENGIDLYKLSELREMPEDFLTEAVISFLAVFPVGFRKTGSSELVHLSRDTNKLTYEMEHTTLNTMGGLTIGKLVGIFMQLVSPNPLSGVPDIKGAKFRRANERQQQMEFTLPIETIAEFHDGQKIPVSHFLFVYWMDTGRVMKPMLFDPTMFRDLDLKYDYLNALTGESNIIPAHDLILGFDNVLQAGRFYTQPQIKFYYYCEWTTETEARLDLIESYQHGILVSAEFAVRLPDANPYYIEITDDAEIDRLQRMLERFRNLPRQ